MQLILQIHSILRWLVLLAAVYAILKALGGMQRNRSFDSSDNRAGFMFMLICDIQLLLGLILYFTSGLGYNNIRDNGMGYVMKDSFARFFAVEHITMMLLAIILVHIGRAQSKKAIGDLARHKRAFWFFLIALILMLASIPWPFRKGFEAVGWY